MNMQNLNKNYNVDISGMVQDYKKLGELTPGYKLLVYKDTKGSHLDISWGSSEGRIGQVIQSTGRTINQMRFGGYDRNTVFTHIKLINQQTDSYLKNVKTIIQQANNILKQPSTSQDVTELKAFLSLADRVEKDLKTLYDSLEKVNEEGKGLKALPAAYGEKDMQDLGLMQQEIRDFLKEVNQIHEAVKSLKEEATKVGDETLVSAAESPANPVSDFSFADTVKTSKQEMEPSLSYFTDEEAMRLLETSAGAIEKFIINFSFADATELIDTIKERLLESTPSPESEPIFREPGENSADRVSFIETYQAKSSKTELIEQEEDINRLTFLLKHELKKLSDANYFATLKDIDRPGKLKEAIKDLGLTQEIFINSLASLLQKAFNKDWLYRDRNLDMTKEKALDNMLKAIPVIEDLFGKKTAKTLVLSYWLG